MSIGCFLFLKLLVESQFIDKVYMIHNVYEEKYFFHSLNGIHYVIFRLKKDNVICFLDDKIMQIQCMNYMQAFSKTLMEWFVLVSVCFYFTIFPLLWIILFFEMSVENQNVYLLPVVRYHSKLNIHYNVFQI